ncbi:MAG TPA: SRPBCC family protein [Candidatus Angelobacter sp.]|jgi:ligand-binding SRPBCC domain-containing protein|nr:SRPBCC family protein [Candidatus Angelobacter sp.]
MADATYILNFKQQVQRPLPEIFDFFSRAENLEALTPPWLNFRILNVNPQPVQQGTMINYSLRVHGIPLRWTSEIVEWEPPHCFVDLQLRGPYKLWRHEHRFEPSDGGTLISDTISLSLPLGFLGQLAYKIKVRSDVQEIFAFRKNKIRTLFG